MERRREREKNREGDEERGKGEIDQEGVRWIKRERGRENRERERKLKPTKHSFKLANRKIASWQLREE